MVRCVLFVQLHGQGNAATWVYFATYITIRILNKLSSSNASVSPEDLHDGILPSRSQRNWSVLSSHPRSYARTPIVCLFCGGNQFQTKHERCGIFALSVCTKQTSTRTSLMNACYLQQNMLARTDAVMAKYTIKVTNPQHIIVRRFWNRNKHNIVKTTRQTLNIFSPVYCPDSSKFSSVGLCGVSKDTCNNAARRTSCRVFARTPTLFANSWRPR